MSDHKPILVIGGGPAGMEATRGIAELGYKAVLVEKRDVLVAQGHIRWTSGCPWEVLH